MAEQEKPNELAQGDTPKVPVEEVSVLKAQLAQLEEQLAQTSKGLSTAHQTVAARDKELKEYKDLRTEIKSIRGDLELLATAIAMGEQPDSDEVVRAVPDVVKRLQQKKKDEDTQQKQADYNRKANDLFERAKGVFTDDDTSLERIEDLLIQGRIETAESRVSKAEAKKTQSSKVELAESEESRVKRLAEEMYRNMVKDKGLLIDETGGPSAVSASVAEAIAKYAHFEISEQEAQRAGVTF